MVLTEQYLQRLIADNFVQLMAWIEQTQSMGRHPSLMAAALQLAAEACKVVFLATASPCTLLV